MSLSTLVRTQAENKIAAYGKTITLTRVTQGAYDTATGVAVATTVTETIKAIVEDYKGREIQGAIQIGDKKILVAASAVAKPSTLDKITLDSETFSIVSVQTIYIQELSALHIVQARKA